VSGTYAADFDFFKNPFNKNSAHHCPIGTGAMYAADDDPATVVWLKYGFSNVNSPSSTGYGFTFYKTDPSYPEATVTTQKGSVTLRLPPNLTAPTGREGVVIVYDPATQTVYDFIHWRSSPQPSADHFVSSNIKGTGHPAAVGAPRVGVSASGVEGFFGMMRGHEVNTPGCKIQHVAQFSVHWKSGPDILAGYAVWPAGSTDGGGKNQTGPFPYGSLIAIPPVSKGGPDLDKLGLSEPGRRLAESLRDYGGYITDSTVGSVNMRADQEVKPEVRIQLTVDMKKVYPYLRLVKNNAPDQSASGGGTPLAPNTAFDAPAAQPTSNPP
jgi:hypothetical protein